MNSPDILAHNRVIFCHFDGYSTALVFPRKGKTVLWPEALPEGAHAMSELVLLREVFNLINGAGGGRA